MLMVRGGIVGLHKVDGAFVTVSDDVFLSTVEGEFGVLIVALSQLIRHSAVGVMGYAVK